MTQPTRIMTTDDRLDHLEGSFEDLRSEVGQLKSAVLGNAQFRTRGVLDSVQDATAAIKELTKRMEGVEEAVRDTRKFFGLVGVNDIKSALTLVSLVFAIGKGFGWW